MTELPTSPAARHGLVRVFGWGLVSQVASSATNLGLSLIAARSLGPGGLGDVSVAFAYYLLALSLQRALITEPLVSTTASLPGADRQPRTRAALTTALCWAALCSAGAGITALLLPSTLATGILAMLPWLAPVLIQDFWRSVLFRDGRGRQVAVNDAAWLVTMWLSLPILYVSQSVGSVIAVWGLGGAAGAMLGAWQTRTAPSGLSAMRRWWETLWRLGRWLSLNTLLYSLSSQGFVFMVGLVAGATALGGLRAAETLFAPLTIIGPAMALPGLPAVARRSAQSTVAGRDLAVRIGAATAGLTLAYSALAVLLSLPLMTHVFGEEFSTFSSLVWPLAIGQVLCAPAFGFSLLLMAQGRGRPLALSGAIKAVVLVVGGPLLTLRFGTAGAAWALAASWVVQHFVITVAIYARHPRRPDSLAS